MKSIARKRLKRWRAVAVGAAKYEGMELPCQPRRECATATAAAKPFCADRRCIRTVNGPAQNVTCVYRPITNASGILPVPLGRMMYCRLGRRVSQGVSFAP